MLCEDVLTTGLSLKKLEEAVRRAVPDCEVVPEVPVFCNRSAHASPYGDRASIPGRRVLALVNRPMPDWARGENPFTPDGAELVEPVRPKESGWATLNASYE